MEFTAEEQVAFFQNVYGCNPHELKITVENSSAFKSGGPGLAVAGLLSDAQEEIMTSRCDDARKTINCVKFLISRYWMTEEQFSS